jgi:hypothetical protein
MGKYKNLNSDSKELYISGPTDHGPFFEVIDKHLAQGWITVQVDEETAVLLHLQSTTICTDIAQKS